jgi:hypothetical protein
MTITKKISLRMVEAKRRLRLQRATAPTRFEPAGHVPIPRRGAARWTITIRDGERGDRLRFSLYRTPWPNQWICDDAMVSTAAVLRRFKALLSHAPAA